MPYVPPSVRKARRNQLRIKPHMEVLESRDLPAGGLIHPDFILGPHGSGPAPLGGPTPLGGPGGFGYTPAHIAHAYGIDQVSFGGGTIPANGAGMTIAIVDAYDQPN